MRRERWFPSRVCIRSPIVTPLDEHQSTATRLPCCCAALQRCGGRGGFRPGYAFALLLSLR
eukprot:364953-Chlamydomonas_euryale.AAC.5